METSEGEKIVINFQQYNLNKPDIYYHGLNRPIIYVNKSQNRYTSEIHFEDVKIQVIDTSFIKFKSIFLKSSTFIGLSNISLHASSISSDFMSLSNIVEITSTDISLSYSYSHSFNLSILPSIQSSITFKNFEFDTSITVIDNHLILFSQNSVFGFNFVNWTFPITFELDRVFTRVSIASASAHSKSISPEIRFLIHVYTILEFTASPWSSNISVYSFLSSTIYIGAERMPINIHSFGHPVDIYPSHKYCGINLLSPVRNEVRIFSKNSDIIFYINHVTSNNHIIITANDCQVIIESISSQPFNPTFFHFIGSAKYSLLSAGPPNLKARFSNFEFNHNINTNFNLEEASSINADNYVINKMILVTPQYNELYNANIDEYFDKSIDLICAPLNGGSFECDDFKINWTPNEKPGFGRGTTLYEKKCTTNATNKCLKIFMKKHIYEVDKTFCLFPRDGVDCGCTSTNIQSINDWKKYVGNSVDKLTFHVCSSFEDKLDFSGYRNTDVVVKSLYQTGLVATTSLNPKSLTFENVKLSSNEYVVDTALKLYSQSSISESMIEKLHFSEESELFAPLEIITKLRNRPEKYFFTDLLFDRCTFRKSLISFYLNNSLVTECNQKECGVVFNNLGKHVFEADSLSTSTLKIKNDFSQEIVIKGNWQSKSSPIVLDQMTSKLTVESAFVPITFDRNSFTTLTSTQETITFSKPITLTNTMKLTNQVEKINFNNISFIINGYLEGFENTRVEIHDGSISANANFGHLSILNNLDIYPYQVELGEINGRITIHYNMSALPSIHAKSIGDLTIVLSHESQYDDSYLFSDILSDHPLHLLCAENMNSNINVVLMSNYDAFNENTTLFNIEFTDKCVVMRKKGEDVPTKDNKTLIIICSVVGAFVVGLIIAIGLIIYFRRAKTQNDNKLGVKNLVTLEKPLISEV